MLPSALTPLVAGLQTFWVLDLQSFGATMLLNSKHIAAGLAWTV